MHIHMTVTDDVLCDLLHRNICRPTSGCNLLYTEDGKPSRSLVPYASSFLAEAVSILHDVASNTLDTHTTGVWRTWCGSGAIAVLYSFMCCTALVAPGDATLPTESSFHDETWLIGGVCNTPSARRAGKAGPESLITTAYSLTHSVVSAYCNAQASLRLPGTPWGTSHTQTLAVL